MVRNRSVQGLGIRKLARCDGNVRMLHSERVYVAHCVIVPKSMAYGFMLNSLQAPKVSEVTANDVLSKS